MPTKKRSAVVKILFAFRDMPLAQAEVALELAEEVVRERQAREVIKQPRSPIHKLPATGPAPDVAPKRKYKKKVKPATQPDLPSDGLVDEPHPDSLNEG